MNLLFLMKNDSIIKGKTVAELEKREDDSGGTKEEKREQLFCHCEMNSNHRVTRPHSDMF